MRVTIDSVKTKFGLFRTRCNSCEGLYPDSMDVRFSKSCDNRCLFCIERDGIHSAKFNIDRMIISTLASGKKEILILGGEPFLFVDRLWRYVKGIRPSVDKIYITTALPETLDISNTKVVDIINTVDGINCSVHYHNDVVNNQILNTITSHSRLNILKTLLMHYPEKIRVMGNLCKGGLDNQKSIRDYVVYMTDIGAKEIKLNELQESPNLYVSFEKVMRCKLPSPYAQGCQRYVFIDGYRCLLKRSCFMVEESKKAY